MNLSEKLKLLRKREKMTQKALGELCGVSRQTVTKWESGVFPDMEKLLCLCEVFNVTAYCLLREEPEIDTVKISTCHSSAAFAAKVRSDLREFL